MTGDDDDERVAAARLQRVQHLLLFAFTRASGEEDFALTEPRTKLRAPLTIFRARRAIELEIAGHRHLGRTQRVQPVCVATCLCGNAGELAEGLRRERREARVAMCRTLRHARIDQKQWNRSTAASVNQIRPDLRFQEQAELRSEVREKPRDCARQIVGQITAQHAGPEHLLAGLSAGRCHMREQDIVIRPAATQRSDQRLSGTRLTYGYAVQPYNRCSHIGRVVAEALGDMLPIPGLPSPAPPEPYQSKWREDVQQSGIDAAPRAHDDARFHAARTSATPGAAFPSPTLTARSEAYRPVAVGSVAQ